MEQTYFQKGFGLRSEIRPQLHENYRSQIVDLMRANGFRLDVGDITFLLAMEFGFCYGVERAVEYAYETVARFPKHRIFLTGEIIHNPHVNSKLQRMGIQFLPSGPQKYDDVRKEDVVLIPAFGIPRADIELLSQKRCIVVDTTCGSVLNVWKNVERYARLGVTSVIHGKFEHEETEATFSRTTLYAGAPYLVIRDKAEAICVCDYIEGATRSREDFMKRFQNAVSPGFDPDLHLERIGLANQTTMLSSESLEIAEMLRVAMTTRYGPSEMTERFHSFDTICSATQDRQDAVRQLEKEHIDVMIVIGGYNSSNTNNLTRIAASFTPTFHIEDAAALSADEIRHKPAGSSKEVVTRDWFADDMRMIGITAGASTPNNQIGETIERILSFRGTIDLASILGAQ